MSKTHSLEDIKKAFRRRVTNPAKVIRFGDLIAQARTGDCGALCANLSDPALQLGQPHLSLLADLIRDATEGELRRPPHRPRKSDLSRTHEQKWERLIVGRLREHERRRGKQFRGEERRQLIETLRKQIPKELRPSTAQIEAFIKHGRV
jgi:hypothetical protein